MTLAQEATTCLVVSTCSKLQSYNVAPRKGMRSDHSNSIFHECSLMPTVQVVRNQSIELKVLVKDVKGGFTLWVPESMTLTHPGMQLLQRRSRAGSQISIMRSAKSGMRVKWGHFSWEKASMFLGHGVEVLGQCSDEDMVSWSEVTAQFQEPLLPSSLLFLISWTSGNFRMVCPAWQRWLGQRLGIAASCDCDTDAGDRNENQQVMLKAFFFKKKLFVVEIKLN